MLGKHHHHTSGSPPLPTAKDLVVRAWIETKGQGEPAFLGRFKLLMRSNPQCQDPVYEHYALAILRNLVRVKSANLNNEARAKKVKKRSDDQLEIALLFTIMPNTKFMCDCTGLEMSKFGKGYERIAERVGPDRKVGDVLNEEEVSRLMKLSK